MSYNPYSIQLTNHQKPELAKAYNDNKAITLRLKREQLNGNDEMFLTKTQINKIKNSIKNNKSADLKISKSQIRKSITKGCSLFSSLASLIPLAIKIGSKLLPGSATGALSSLGSFAANKILGSGLQNRPASRGGSNIYQIPSQNLPQLNNCLNFLTNPQKLSYIKALQTGKGMRIKLNQKQQNGGFLGTLLASIGIPILLKALTSGSSKKAAGLQNRSYNENMNPPPPFFENWNQISGKGLTKKK